MQMWWQKISSYNIQLDILNKYIGFIYITINRVNGRSYIGKKHFNHGWENYLGSGKILQQAINKEGEDNFYKVIIGFAKTEEELDDMEKEIIAINNATKNKDFYNISDGGKGGNVFSGYTEEEFRAYCKSRCGENNPYYGRHHSDEVKKKMMKKRKNRIYNPMSEEAKRKISESQKKRLDINNPNKHKFVIIFKNGIEKEYPSFFDMRKALGIEKRDYYRWKKYDIPKYRSLRKLELINSIKKIFENGELTYDSQNIQL